MAGSPLATPPLRSIIRDVEGCQTSCVTTGDAPAPAASSRAGHAGQSADDGSRPAERPRRLLPRARGGRGATCTSGPCMVFEGRAPVVRGAASRSSSGALPLVPRYRQKLAFPPLGSPAPSGSTIRTSTSRYHLRHTAPAAARRRGRAPAPGGPRVLPAAGPRQAAVGALAGRRRGRGPLRAHLQDPPLPRRRRLRRRHRHGDLRRGARPAGRAAAPEPWVAAPRAAAHRAARRRRRGARRRAGRARPRSRARARASAAGRRRERLGASPASGRSAWPGSRPRPRSPLNVAHRPAPPLRLGGRRPRGRSRRSSTALGGTVNDVVLAVVARRPARAPAARTARP